MASRAQLHAELIGFLRQHCLVRDQRHLVLLAWMVAGLLLSETVCFDRWKARLPLAHCLASRSVYNNVDALINLGSGSDILNSSSNIDTGRNRGTIVAGIDSEVDSDQITGFQGVTATLEEEGLYNSGTYKLGGGNDIVTGQGAGGGYGIYNDGFIYMESGDDTISDLLTGNNALQYGSLGNYKGIFNSGLIDMGLGNDTVKGFAFVGTGKYIGGAGIDTLSIGKDGSYVVTAISGGYSINNQLVFNSFEQIKSRDSQTSLAFSAGTYMVSNNGQTIEFLA